MWGLLFSYLTPILSIYFLPKTPRKYLRNLIKLIYGHEKHKNPSQNTKFTRHKKMSQAQI